MRRYKSTTTNTNGRKMADVDFELVSTMLLLCGDQQSEVSSAARLSPM